MSEDCLDMGFGKLTSSVNLNLSQSVLLLVKLLNSVVHHVLKNNIKILSSTNVYIFLNTMFIFFHAYGYQYIFFMSYGNSHSD
jgi:predicted transporter